MSNRYLGPQAGQGDAHYERARDLPAALGESALEGTFGNIRELVAALRQCVEHPAGATLGDLATALGALRGELAIMNEQVETLVAPITEPHGEKNGNDPAARLPSSTFEHRPVCGSRSLTPIAAGNPHTRMIAGRDS